MVSELSDLWHVIHWVSTPGASALNHNFLGSGRSLSVPPKSQVLCPPLGQLFLSGVSAIWTFLRDSFY